MRIALLFIGLLFLAACSSDPALDEGRPAVCAQDNMICPDGSIVMREGVNCEFRCPEAPKDECGYTMDDRQYWHHDLRECASANPKCDVGWVQFSDACGCGCERANLAGQVMDIPSKKQKNPG